MEFLKNNARGIIISLLVAGAIIGIASLSNDDTATNDEAETSQTEGNTENTQEGNTEESNESMEKEESEGESSGEAQPQVNSSEEEYDSTTITGDNQTVVVRRIVEDYLKGAETELSAEQKLYVETNLVNDLGRNDFVAVGQSISLSKADVEKRVEEAKQLSEAKIALWSQYL